MKKRNNLREGEWKVRTEKPDPKLKTRNNFLNPHSITRGNHYPDLDWQICQKREPPEMRSVMKVATR